MQQKHYTDYNKERYLQDMANLIRLKQIESGSALQTSAQIGTDISGSVISIISSSLGGALSVLATDVEVAAISA